MLQGVHNNFDTDLFTPIIERVLKLETKMDIVTARVIADHIRSSIFLIADGVYPSNEGRGYVLRRVMRRAIGFAYNVGLKQSFLAELSLHVISQYQAAYTELVDKKDIIYQMIKDEEERFSKTISQGMTLLDNILIQGGKCIDGKTLFKLYDTYGFPLDMTEKIAAKKDVDLDIEGYEACHLSLN